MGIGNYQLGGSQSEWSLGILGLHKGIMWVPTKDYMGLYSKSSIRPSGCLSGESFRMSGSTQETTVVAGSQT